MEIKIRSTVYRYTFFKESNNDKSSYKPGHCQYNLLYC